MSATPSVAALAAAVNPDKTIRKQRAAEYPKEVWYFLASFIFLVALSNLVSVLWGLRRTQRRVEGGAEGTTSRLGTISYRRFPLAFVNAWRVVAFRSVINLGGGYSVNMAEFLMTAMYIIALFLWSLINTTNLSGKKFDPQYYSDRTAHIAAVQLPLIAALGTKNNIIAFLTGVSFEKLSYLHRMCARTIVVMIWLHAGGRLQLGLKSDTAAYHGYIRSGMTAASALTILAIVSVRPARRAAYEIFVAVHFVLVLIVLLGAFFHTRQFGVSYYVWPTFMIWVLDRVIRVIRLIAFNQSYFGLKSGLGTFNATVEAAAPGFVRIRFRRPAHLHWYPGQSAFLTMPSVSNVPFESHPFTIANTDRESTSDTAQASPGKDLVFVVRTREGFTKRLGSIADGNGFLKIFVDGPYGAPPNLKNFDTVVFIAGGSGVTFTSPVFTDLVHRIRENASSCRNIVFVWAIRDASHVNLVYDDLLNALQQELPSCTIDVRIHITGPDTDSITGATKEGSSLDSAEMNNEKSAHAISDLPRTRAESGRPNVQNIIEEAASLASGNMSVNVCGPASLAADARRALRSPGVGPMNVLRGGPSINLFVETFGYA